MDTVEIHNDSNELLATNSEKLSSGGGVANMSSLDHTDVIGLLDMDAFEVQIYLHKQLGKKEGRDFYLSTPVVLADTTTDRIISVNFLAKAHEISREDRLPSALKKCPSLSIIRKELRHNKPENYNLRHASWSVLDSILEWRKINRAKSMVVEYASNDEFYLDLTTLVDERMANYPITPNIILGPKTFLEERCVTLEVASILAKYRQLVNKREEKCDNFPQLLRLVVGCSILEEIKSFIFDTTHFECSGGLGMNKVLAKLACPLHKPGGMTILPQEGLLRVSKNIPLEKLPGLGGEKGAWLRERLEISSVAELATTSHDKMWQQAELGIMTSMQVRRLANGIRDEAVIEKLIKESASVGKGNLQNLRLRNIFRFKSVLFDLLSDFLERMGEEESRHYRIPESFSLSLSYIIFPPRDKDGEKLGEKTFGNKSLTYSYDELKQIGNNDFVLKVLQDFCELLAMNGVVTKITFVVKSFNSLKP